MKQHGHPGQDAFDIGYVGHDVVGVNDPWTMALVTQDSRECPAEECASCRHTVLLGCLRDVPRRVDPQHTQAVPPIVLQEVPVVASDLHREVAWTEVPALDLRFDV